MSTALTKPNFAWRLYRYTQERFPLTSYGLMSVLFAAAGLAISSALRLGTASFNFSALLCAALTSAALFFQLRVADEHKDHEEDCLYQSERAVPRGLISLFELRTLAVFLAGVQLLLCSLSGWVTLLCLLVTWTYFALMAKEFFVSKYLRAHPFTYMFSHLFILVFSDLLITSFDFIYGASQSLAFFYIASFMSGIVIEVGRKIRHPLEEREGVETYSKLLGRSKASLLLAGALLCSQVFIVLVLSAVPSGVYLPVFAAAFFACFDLGAGLVAASHLNKQTVGKVFGVISNLSVMVSYLTVIIATRSI